MMLGTRVLVPGTSLLLKLRIVADELGRLWGGGGGLPENCHWEGVSLLIPSCYSAKEAEKRTVARLGGHVPSLARSCGKSWPDEMRPWYLETQSSRVFVGCWLMGSFEAPAGAMRIGRGETLHPADWQDARVSRRGRLVLALGTGG